MLPIGTIVTKAVLFKTVKQNSIEITKVHYSLTNILNSYFISVSDIHVTTYAK